MSLESAAAIVAIGSEMLGPHRQDTNSLWLAARLEEIGIRVVRKSVVGDDPPAIVREIERAASEAALIVTTGGLGPTADDVTVGAVASWLGRAAAPQRGIPRGDARAVLVPGNPDAARQRKTGRLHRGCPGAPQSPGHGARILGPKDSREIVILPGVPSEMREIMQGTVLPELAARSGGKVLRRRVLRIAGIGESAVEELVEPVYARWKEHPVTILASPGEVQLHLAVLDVPDRANETLAAMEADFRQVLGKRVFGEDGEELAEAVGRLLRDQGRTLALAESCTGGMVSSLITDIPGSSAYFLGGVVSYANDAKESLLGVHRETLETHGAVSSEAAREMARGATDRFGADVGASITGIAGPDGGSAEKPVGTVWFGIADRDGREIVKRRAFLGDRTHIRRTASVHALELLRRHLVGWGEE